MHHEHEDKFAKQAWLLNSDLEEVRIFWLVINFIVRCDEPVYLTPSLVLLLFRMHFPSLLRRGPKYSDYLFILRVRRGSTHSSVSIVKTFPLRCNYTQP